MKYSNSEKELFNEAGIYVEDKDYSKVERENLKIKLTDYIMNQSSKDINNLNKKFSNILYNQNEKKGEENMKVLYVVNTCDNKYVNFHAVQVMSENESEFEILDKMNVENYVHNFPKDKIDIELELAYVTDKLDKETLKVQIDRIYNKLREKYIENIKTKNHMLAYVVFE